MTTQSFTLTQTPVQISNGTKAVYVQEIRGKLTRFACSTTSPSTSVYAQILNGDVSVGVGFPLWAWTPDSNLIQITVLQAE